MYPINDADRWGFVLVGLAWRWLILPTSHVVISLSLKQPYGCVDSAEAVLQYMGQ